VAVGNGGAQALPSWCTAPHAGHIGRSPGLVDEHEAGGVEIELPLEPGFTPPQDVRPFLLGRVRRLFFTVMPCRSKKRHSPP